jgi:hypothetical protein
MSTLIPVAFIEKSQTPFVWTCSECGEVFALERMTPMPTSTQVQKVNSNFSIHCKHLHDGPIVGLPMSATQGDFSQNALRIVKEATENK